MKKRVLLKAIPLLFFVPAMAAATVTQLSSCSIFVPKFNVFGPNTHDWMEGTQFDCLSQWEGYYFDDVPIPSEADNTIIIPPEHKEDIEVDLANTQKILNPTNKTEQCQVRFKILTDKPRQDTSESFYITVIWKVLHSSVHQEKRVEIQPYSNITINADYSSGSTPKNVDNPIDPATLNNNSINIVDGVYNTKNNATDGDVATNIENDFVYWQYLLFSSLKSIYIDDSLSLFASVDPSSWVAHVDAQYVIATQTFNYIHLKVSGTGLCSIGTFTVGTATVDIGYWWGNFSNPNSHETNSNYQLGDGPQLFGAYSIDKTNFTHFPQGDVSKPPVPYDQNYLSLVPSSEDSFQLYDYVVAANMTITKETIGSGYHSYFLQQPRMSGLEYTTGQCHVSTAADGQGHTDAFQNLGLNIPSYTLSGMGYNTDPTKGDIGFYQKFGHVDINKCNVNIDTNKPTLVNKIAPGNGVTFANNFMQPYPVKDFTDDIDSDGKPIDPTSFITAKKTEFTNHQACVSSNDGDKWRNLSINGPSGFVYDNDTLGPVTYYKVLQGRAIGGGAPKSGSTQQKGNNFSTYKNGQQNLSFKNNAFNRFGFGLNYMFDCGSMWVDASNPADNLFYYSSPSDIPLSDPT